MDIPSTYQRIVLASRPRGPVLPENFRLETVPVPELADGQVLIRNHYLSLDPYTVSYTHLTLPTIYSV